MQVFDVIAAGKLYRQLVEAKQSNVCLECTTCECAAFEPQHDESKKCGDYAEDQLECSGKVHVWRISNRFPDESDQTSSGLIDRVALSTMLEVVDVLRTAFNNYDKTLELQGVLPNLSLHGKGKLNEVGQRSKCLEDV